MRSCQGENAIVTGNSSHPTADEVNIPLEEADLNNENNSNLKKNNGRSKEVKCLD